MVRSKSEFIEELERAKLGLLIEEMSSMEKAVTKTLVEMGELDPKYLQGLQ